MTYTIRDLLLVTRPVRNDEAGELSDSLIKSKGVKEQCYLRGLISYKTRLARDSNPRQSRLQDPHPCSQDYAC